MQLLCNVLRQDGGHAGGGGRIGERREHDGARQRRQLRDGALPKLAPYDLRVDVYYVERGGPTRSGSRSSLI